MNGNDFLQALIFMVVLIALAKPLGLFMARVYEGKIPAIVRWLSPIERIIYRICGIREEEEMNWKVYAGTFLLFNMLSLVVVYAIQRMQTLLPLNPMDMKAVSADSSFNTAVSFATNTNWQGYGGETPMKDFTQMFSLAVPKFFSAAAGI